jgi:hypothetical protein
MEGSGVSGSSFEALEPNSQFETLATPASTSSWFGGFDIGPKASDWANNITLPPGFPSGGGQARVDSIVSLRYSPEALLPEGYNQSYRNLIATWAKVSKNQYSPRYPELKSPNLPTDSEVQTYVNSLLDKNLDMGRTKNANELRAYWLDRASQLIKNNFEISYGNLQNDIRSKALDLLDSSLVKIATMNDKVPFISSSLQATSSQLIRQAAKKSEHNKIDKLINQYANQLARQSNGSQLIFAGYEARMRFGPAWPTPTATITDRPRSKAFGETFNKINSVWPQSYQGVIAKQLAAFFAKYANNQWVPQSVAAQKEAERICLLAFQIIDIGTGKLPIAGQLRDIYEAFDGYDMLTGEKLSEGERALRLTLVASYLFPRDSASMATQKVVKMVNSWRAKSRTPQEGALSVAKVLDKAKREWPDYVKKIEKFEESAKRNASKAIERGKAIPLDIGTMTHEEADILGLSYVGKDFYVVHQDAKYFYYSQDGLRRYRPPYFKDYVVESANLERRFSTSEIFVANGHIVIIK